MSKEEKIELQKQIIEMLLQENLQKSEVIKKMEQTQVNEKAEISKRQHKYNFE